jgi:hypothetical protein
VAVAGVPKDVGSVRARVRDVIGVTTVASKVRVQKRDNDFCGGRITTLDISAGVPDGGICWTDDTRLENAMPDTDVSYRVCCVVVVKTLRLEVLL